MQRLNKFIASSGLCSRRKADELIEAGKVNVNGKELVSVIPVSFVGGSLAFFRTNHRLISVSNIISCDSETIEIKRPIELAVGDFIVVRETEKDIIRELADMTLKNSGKENLRELATIRRDALTIELVFCTFDVLYEKLKDGGCDKGRSTIKRWIEDEELIAPQSKKDLEIIKSVTKNESLIELKDKMPEAISEVRNAHIIAGRKLSEQLKHTIAEELKKYGNIDPFNFWEPINIEIDGIGSIKVLKIIDIGSEVKVISTDANRLIED